MQYGRNLRNHLLGEEAEVAVVAVTPANAMAAGKCVMTIGRKCPSVVVRSRKAPCTKRLSERL